MPLRAMGGPLSDSTKAHRLMAKAWELQGAEGQDSIARQIFKAYNEDELDIGDDDVLSDIAEEAGLMTKETVRSCQRDRSPCAMTLPCPNADSPSGSVGARVSRNR